MIRATGRVTSEAAMGEPRSRDGAKWAAKSFMGGRMIFFASPSRHRGSRLSYVEARQIRFAPAGTWRGRGRNREEKNFFFASIARGKFCRSRRECDRARYVKSRCLRALLRVPCVCAVIYFSFRPRRKILTSREKIVDSLFIHLYICPSRKEVTRHGS